MDGSGCPQQTGSAMRAGNTSGLVTTVACLQKGREVRQLIPGWPGLTPGPRRLRSKGGSAKWKRVGTEARENQARPDTLTSLPCDSGKMGQPCPLDEGGVKSTKMDTVRA